ncbi:hypothetical protein JOF29_004666 [Kribbella aluminosa]|uniref:TPM domain-containing protein n=1 Tax=Kribbella aluminosa TaxID=416017 RepID=A0ABS4UPJ5_9ACTN|nr:hypothetical protein [Kribbella aluminosa]MBP2353556.1 hypothetical protein [Kribbella aluminosa]
MRRLLLLLTATVFLLTGTAWAATPTDPRITGAVAAWAVRPLYVDPDYTSIADQQEIVKVLAEAKVPVYVAVVPTGAWFPERGDTALLAGRLAVANHKPGVYVVMDGDRTYGVAHELAADAPSWTYSTGKQSLSGQLADYLHGVEQDKSSTPEPARTTPTPTPAPESGSPGTEDRFTVGKALANGAGGTVFGMVGGGILGGIVLLVAAIATPRRRKGRS